MPCTTTHHRVTTYNAAKLTINKTQTTRKSTMTSDNNGETTRHMIQQWKVAGSLHFVGSSIAWFGSILNVSKQLESFNLQKHGMSALRRVAQHTFVGGGRGSTSFATAGWHVIKSSVLTPHMGKGKPFVAMGSVTRVATRTIATMANFVQDTILIFVYWCVFWGKHGQFIQREKKVIYACKQGQDGLIKLLLLLL